MEVCLGNCFPQILFLKKYLKEKKWLVPHHKTEKSITAMSQCSLTGTDKTVINTGIYFQSQMPVYFQELPQYCTEI
jgi:hypothetical protein